MKNQNILIGTIIFFILSPSVLANVILDPSFEKGSGLSISANWTESPTGTMSISRTVGWATDETHSCRIDDTFGCGCTSGGTCGIEDASDYIFQSIDLTGIETIVFDAKLSMEVEMEADLNVWSNNGNMTVFLDSENCWTESRTDYNGDVIFTNITINVSDKNGIYELRLYSAGGYSASCTGCSPGCAGSFMYDINTHYDNFTTILSDIPSESEATQRFNNLFNSTSTWDMLSSIFETYESVCGATLFWLIIILIPFIMSWIKTQSVIIPSILALITGSTLFVLLPIEAIGTIKILMMIGIAGLLYHIIKSR